MNRVIIVGHFSCQRGLYVFKLVGGTIIVLNVRSVEIPHGPTALDSALDCVIYGTYPSVHVFLRSRLIDALILWSDDLETESPV